MIDLENVTLIERGKTLRKIKGLQRSKKEYTAIRNIKQEYLNSLQHYVNYASINIECHRVQQELKTLDSQLSDMEVKLISLMKEL